MGKRGAVVSVRKCSRARVLEELRVRRRPARARAVVVVPAAQLVRTESHAPTLAPNYMAPCRCPHLKHVGTRGEEVGAASDDGALPLALVRGDGHADVEAVDEADAVGGEVAAAAVVEGDLGKGGWGGAAETAALKAAAAVAGCAGEAAAGECAAGPAPDAAGPVVGRGREGPVSQSREGEAPLLENVVARVGLDSRPHRERTVVDHGQRHGRVLGCHLLDHYK